MSNLYGNDSVTWNDTLLESRNMDPLDGNICFSLRLLHQQGRWLLLENQIKSRQWGRSCRGTRSSWFSLPRVRPWQMLQNARQWRNRGMLYASMWHRSSTEIIVSLFTTTWRLNSYLYIDARYKDRLRSRFHYQTFWYLLKVRIE